MSKLNSKIPYRRVISYLKKFCVFGRIFVSEREQLNQCMPRGSSLV